MCTNYTKIRNLRDTIDGELNRIMVSDNEHEIHHLHDYLVRNIDDYYTENLSRVYNKTIHKGENYDNTRKI